MNRVFLRTVLLVNLLLIFSQIFAQYPPPAGQPGTTAMYKDSSAFLGWASSCIIERGFVNAGDTAFLYNGSNKTTYGSYLLGSGPADELVVSLGDHGSALLGFDIPIVNRPGPDFAVFENSFGNGFLELGFVEVSSDGQHFVRFPSVSLTSDSLQVSTFDTLDARTIHNLAGKYRLTFGTPFDLESIADSAGINILYITHIRIVDVGGCLQAPYATYDSQDHKINDPWPTPFDTGGFDFDAIGVINNESNGSDDEWSRTGIRIFPNPVMNSVTFESPLSAEFHLKISGTEGKTLIERNISGKSRVDMSSVPAGIYLAVFTLKDGTSFTKKIIKY
jgi:hypothetical protein